MFNYSLVEPGFEQAIDRPTYYSLETAYFGADNTCTWVYDCRCRELLSLLSTY